MSNEDFIGRYKVGDTVRLLTEASEYYLLIGKVVDVHTNFGYMGTVRFPKSELEKARRPERVLNTSDNGLVWVYWRELQEVICG